MWANIAKVFLNGITLVIATGTIYFLFDEWRHANAPVMGYLLLVYFGFLFCFGCFFVWMAYLKFWSATFKESYILHYLLVTMLAVLIRYFSIR